MYVNSISDFIQLNFLPLVIILFMGFFLVMNNKYEPSLTKSFRPLFYFLIVLIIADNIDYRMLDTKSWTQIHVFVAIVGYNMRIWILLRLVTIMEYDIVGRIHKWLCIPAILNFFVLLSAFKTHLTFWYATDGSMHRGVLGYSSHMTLALYLLFGMYLTWKAYEKGTHTAAIIIVIEEILCVFGTLIELKCIVRGMLIGVIALNIVFYYLYLHICKFYRDPLTGAFNRASFYADLNRYDTNISAIYSIDLNGLKQKNDTEGHQAGDKLLRKATISIQECLLPRCYLYRTGGDEFVIICINLGRKQVQDLTGRLFTCQKNKCDFAFGMHEFHESATATFRLADDAMYANKRNMKAIRVQK